jgi:hypothetical protein
MNHKYAATNPAPASARSAAEYMEAYDTRWPMHAERDVDMDPTSPATSRTHPAPPTRSSF